jgi:hypothetical protein
MFQHLSTGFSTIFKLNNFQKAKRVKYQKQQFLLIKSKNKEIQVIGNHSV